MVGSGSSATSATLTGRRRTGLIWLRSTAATASWRSVGDGVKPPKAEPKSVAAGAIAAGAAVDDGDGTSAPRGMAGIAGGADAAEPASTRPVSRWARSKLVPAAGCRTGAVAITLVAAAVDAGRATDAIDERPAEPGTKTFDIADGPELVTSAGRGAGIVAATTACNGAVAGSGAGMMVARTTGVGAEAIAPAAVPFRLSALRVGAGLAMSVACGGKVGLGTKTGVGTNLGTGRCESAGLLGSGALPRTAGPSSTDRTVGAGTEDGGGAV